jgi:hypothetical protein
VSRNFDGVDDSIQSNDTLEGIPSGPISFGCWMYAEGTGEAGLGCPIRRQGTQVVTLNYQASGSRLAMVVTRTTSNMSRHTNAFTTGAWHHIFTTWDGGLTDRTTSIKIYKNGVEVSYTADGGNGSGTHNSSDGELLMGNNQAATITFDGFLAHGHFYNRVLSATEIGQVMRFPGSVVKGLIVYWPINSVSPEPDYSGRGHPGTVSGTTTSPFSPPINNLFYPRRPNRGYDFVEAAVGGLSIPVAMHDYRRRRAT